MVVMVCNGLPWLLCAGGLALAWGMVVRCDHRCRQERATREAAFLEACRRAWAASRNPSEPMSLD